MAIASAPSVVNSGSFYAWVNKNPSGVTSGVPAINDRNVVRVGSVVVQPGDNTTVPLGGTFDVWYNKATHAVLIDIVSTQLGGQPTLPA